MHDYFCNICTFCAGSVLSSSQALADCTWFGKVSDSVRLSAYQQAFEVITGHHQEDGGEECACPVLQEFDPADLVW